MSQLEPPHLGARPEVQLPHGGGDPCLQGSIEQAFGESGRPQRQSPTSPRSPSKSLCPCCQTSRVGKPCPPAFEFSGAYTNQRLLLWAWPLLVPGAGAGPALLPLPSAPRSTRWHQAIHRVWERSPGGTQPQPRLCSARFWDRGTPCPIASLSVHVSTMWEFMKVLRGPCSTDACVPGWNQVFVLGAMGILRRDSGKCFLEEVVLCASKDTADSRAEMRREFLGNLGA